ncbi:hypothetical protein AKO1_015687 [Acrasis kona]|uniref:Uncharacterized protein n=1 Tax=Acrasis kona TaxID=1008807 RepID=A0AAW2ZGU4_9EUKA
MNRVLGFSTCCSWIKVEKPSIQTELGLGFCSWAKKLRGSSKQVLTICSGMKRLGSHRNNPSKHRQTLDANSLLEDGKLFKNEKDGKSFKPSIQTEPSLG